VHKTLTELRKETKKCNVLHWNFKRAVGIFLLLLKEYKISRRHEGIEFAEMQLVSLTGNDLKCCDNY
jgi:hypothetical protein